LSKDGGGDGEFVAAIPGDVVEVDPLVGIAVVDALKDVLVELAVVDALKDVLAPKVEVCPMPVKADGHA
jgi:hypothetical protein